MTEQMDRGAGDSMSHLLLEKLGALRERINQVVIGQPEVIDQVLVALLAKGHVLVEGVPGLGKTLLVRTLAKCFDGEFRRIQFTPDLMPADVTGHVLYNMKEGEFRIRRGPVFTNLLLTDEINRSPAKTQAALLEVMEEHQVTIEGRAQSVPEPFMVMATQNPIEQEGTYPLPEAELDRFLLKVFIGYPCMKDELALTRQVTGIEQGDHSAHSSGSLLTAIEMQKLQQAAANVTVDEQVAAYAVRLVRATRERPVFSRGAGTRACIALVKCARAYALLQKRRYVLPDDVKAMAIPVMRHRVALSVDMAIEGLSADYLLTEMMDDIEAPRL
ncbi:MoxR family ATPase [Kistimonas scapharcae]|uniref:MoxR family ATPase n=2 Tax=Kistimonas scapharcae TaxID=1036133 RepID=A0ABP8V7J4_9GAMM